MNSLPILGLSLLLGAPGVKDAPKKPAVPAIVGEWECVEFVGGGRQAAPGQIPKMVVEFTADGKFRWTEGDKPRDGTYTADPAKDPAEVPYGVDGFAQKNQGIYRVEKDMLTLCVAENGGGRPKTFESPAGTRIMLFTFKRVEKKE